MTCGGKTSGRAAEFESDASIMSVRSSPRAFSSISSCDATGRAMAWR